MPRHFQTTTNGLPAAKHGTHNLLPTFNTKESSPSGDGCCWQLILSV